MSDELRKLERDKYRAKAKGNLKELGEICNYMGEILSRQGNFEEALLAHEEEREVSILRNDTLGTAIAHRRLGECHLELGDFKKSLGHLKEYLELATASGSDVEIQRAFATLGRAYYYRYVAESKNDCLLKAETAFFKALDLAEKLKPHLKERDFAEMRGRLFLNLGLVCDQRGDVEGCAKSLKQAIFLSKKYDFVEDLHRCQMSLANVYNKRKEYTQSLRLLDEAMATAKKSRNKILLCDTMLAKSQAFIMLEDFEGARTLLKKAYRLHSPLQEDHMKAVKNLKIVVVLCECESELLSLPSSDMEKQIKLYEKLGDGCAALGNFEKAIEYYHNMLECAIKLKKPDHILAPIYVSLAETYADCSQYDKALDYYYKELDCRKESLQEQCQSMLKIAEILDVKGAEYIATELAFLNALEIANKCREPKLQSRCLKLLSDYQNEQGFPDKAEKTLAERKLILKKYSDDNSDNDNDNEECASPFDDVCLSDLSPCVDSENEIETKDVPKRPKRSRQVANKVNEVGESPLHLACKSGNLKLAKRLVERGHPVNPRDYCGWTPLHEACNYGFLEIVEYLVEKGAFINDRGGEKCEGITPLHDAAVCGHLEVVKFLLSKGASITARNNKGQTPLDSLRSWRKNMGSELENERRLQCLMLEKEIEDALKRVGQLSDMDLADEPEPGTSRQQVSENDDVDTTIIDSMPSMSSGSDDDDYGLYKNPASSDLKKDFSDPKSACREYQSIMLEMRRPLKELNHSNAALHSSKPQFPALLDEDSLVTGDEWLEDDLNSARKPSKRQCTRSPKVNSSNTKNNNKRQTNDEKLELNFDDDVHGQWEEDGFNVQKSNQEEIQKSMFQTEDFDDLDFGVNSSWETHNPETALRSRDVFHSPLNTDPVASRTTTAQSNYSGSLSSSFSVKVKVFDKLLLIPITEEKNVGWLAEEAALRYSELSGTKQNLILSTEDGAVLSANDRVRDILSNGARLVATIKALKPSSLSERYAEACSAMAVCPLSDITSLLENCAKTTVLSVTHLILPRNHSSFLYRALQDYTALTKLNFNGLPLSDEGITWLAKSINTFTNLTSLRLQCCSLTYISLQKLLGQASVPTVGNHSAYQTLEVLDLSYNPLFDESAYLLGCLLDKFPNLKTLDIVACNFTSYLLQDAHFLNTLRKLCLKELYLGINQFDSIPMSLMLHSLTMKNLTTLNLCATITTSNGTLGNTLSELFVQPFCSLKELCLASCALQDSDLISIAKTICNCPILENFDISNNPDVTALCILELLKVFSSQNLTFDISGCVFWGTESLSVLTRLISYRFLKKIILSCNVSSSDFLNDLCSAWYGIWKEQASCQVQSQTLVELIVSDL